MRQAATQPATVKLQPATVKLNSATVKLYYCMRNFTVAGSRDRKTSSRNCKTLLLNEKFYGFGLVMVWSALNAYLTHCELNSSI